MATKNRKAAGGRSGSRGPHKASQAGSTPAPATIHPSLAALAVPIESLTLDPANARAHPEKSREAIAASLKIYGQRKPIVVQKEGMVVRAGNGVVEAARALGWKEVAAVVIDEETARAVGFAIADNRSAELSEWDPIALPETLLGMVDSHPELLVGFDEADLALLGVGLPTDEELMASADGDLASQLRKARADGEAVEFRFGAYTGFVAMAVYDEFVAKFRAARASGEAPSLEGFLAARF